jgi:hydrogenase-4 membrane subunit HyfE
VLTGFLLGFGTLICLLSHRITGRKTASFAVADNSSVIGGALLISL